MTDMPSAKEEVRRMLEELPDDASWEDIQYSIYVRERIERGRREADEGKLVDNERIAARIESTRGARSRSGSIEGAH